MSTLFSLDMGWKVILNDLALDLVQLFTQARISPDVLDQTNPKISAEQFVNLWHACEQASNRSDFALLVGTAISAESFSPPFIAAQCSENLNMAITRLQRYKPLVGPLKLVKTTMSGGAKLHIESAAVVAIPNTFKLTECIFLTQLARMATRQTLKPLTVYTPLAKEISPSIAEYFGIELTYAEETSIVFDERALQQPFLTENKALWKFIEPQLKADLDKVTQQQSVTEKVTSLLLNLIPAGNASIDVVAEKLFMSKRTLQRKLSNEESNFQQLLNDVRQKLARHYLKDTKLPSNQIAFMLGFDDPNSFIRAFSKWEGASPEAVRKSYSSIS